MTILCRSLAESSDSQSEDDTAREDEELCLPVQCLGRQEGLNVFVMGPSMQFWSDGEGIPPDQQRYVTIKGTLKERPSCLWKQLEDVPFYPHHVTSGFCTSSSFSLMNFRLPIYGVSGVKVT